MVKFYVDRIKAGKLTLEQVPARWREAVEEALSQEAWWAAQGGE